MFDALLASAVQANTAFNQSAFDAAILARDSAWDKQEGSQKRWPTATIGKQASVADALTQLYTSMPDAFVLTRPNSAIVPTSRLYQTETMTKDLPTIARLCSADPHCRGFTTDGYFAIAGAKFMNAPGVDFFQRQN